MKNLVFLLFFLAEPHSVWDPSSAIRDGTGAPGSESTES